MFYHAPVSIRSVLLKLPVILSAAVLLAGIGAGQAFGTAASKNSGAGHSMTGEEMTETDHQAHQEAGTDEEPGGRTEGHDDSDILPDGTGENIKVDHPTGFSVNWFDNRPDFGVALALTLMLLAVFAGAMARL